MDHECYFIVVHPSMHHTGPDLEANYLINLFYLGSFFWGFFYALIQVDCMHHKLSGS